MENKWVNFIFLGASLIVIGFLVIFLGHNLYRNQAQTYDILTMILFTKFAPPFTTVYWYLPYTFLDLYFTIYQLLLEFIQQSLGSLMTSFIYPVLSVITFCLGSIFLVLAIIHIRNQNIGLEPVKKMKY